MSLENYIFEIRRKIVIDVVVDAKAVMPNALFTPERLDSRINKKHDDGGIIPFFESHPHYGNIEPNENTFK